MKFSQKQHRQLLPHRQKGAALAVSLIILLVMTLLVLSSTQNVVMQERMTSSVRDAHVSLAVAEAGVADAEAFIDTRTDLTDFNAAGNNGYYSQDNGPVNVFTDVDWSPSGSAKYQTTLPIDGVIAQYIIIDVGTVQIAEDAASGINLLGYGQTTGGGEVNAFQIISRAAGKSGTAERLVMSYYGKRF